MALVQNDLMAFDQQVTTLGDLQRDDYTGKSFEHRKPIVEARIHQLGEIFVLGI